MIRSKEIKITLSKKKLPDYQSEIYYSFSTRRQLSPAWRNEYYQVSR